MPVKDEIIEWLALRYGKGFHNDSVDLHLSEKKVRIVLKIACQFLTEGARCQIYEQRPQECRDFFCDEVKEKFRVWKEQVIKGFNEKI